MGIDFEALTEATSGAVGGLLSTTILYPLDTCKTKYQAEAHTSKHCKYRSPVDVFKEALKSRQLLSLYQGLGTKNLQSFVSQFIYFYSYSYIKNVYLKRSRRERMGTGANLIVAAAAGACTAIITQPLDTASARMQTSSFGKSRGLWETLTAGDWRQAFDGLGASLVLTSNPAVQYTVFEQLKNRLVAKQGAETAGSVHAVDTSPVVLSAFIAFLLGALSKTVATVVTYPAIRCKVLLQVWERKDDETEQKSITDPLHRPPKKMLDAINIIWHREGALGFYKGLEAQILKTVLSAALMLMIKEKASKGTWVVMMAFRKWLNVNRLKVA
ncbi:hypothetical protein GOP47_0009052 [Adiantum capillus-veneris]|uniref:Peroxisomal adenine nucleotide carrier 1 n=1 Tax=Adiantum capillus-veneris TaxID=13818 RepID=A0A9D4ZKA7_ADICA|nr:hypothetical protein GOP47_0008544 [Adiantum capillus-veneris]KAI5076987.1 hypothetical protein GOP47_0009052 [Adiantum capillus-veneris]